MGAVAVGGSFMSAMSGSIQPLGFNALAFSGFFAGATDGFITGAGNGWIGGLSPEQALSQGCRSGLYSAILGGVSAGVIGGITSVRVKRNFWTGHSIKPKVAELPTISAPAPPVEEALPVTKSVDIQAVNKTSDVSVTFGNVNKIDYDMILKSEALNPHVATKSHLKDGILEIAMLDDQSELVDHALDVVYSQLNFLQNGQNNIVVQTGENSFYTIKAFAKNGTVISINMHSGVYTGKAMNPVIYLQRLK